MCSSLLPLLLVSMLLASSASADDDAVAGSDQQSKQQQQQQQRPYVQLIRRSLAADAATRVAAADRIDATGIPVYGNWCGPNYGSGTPVDEIDACCKSHDDCYDSSVGYNHCSCDQAIVRCLNKITSIQSRNLVKRAMRASIVTYFDNTACRCGKQAPICMPVKSCPCQGSG